MNLWVHDGCKDVSVNHYLYRSLLKDSLDQIFAESKTDMKDCIEGKVFGIGLESFTVGSHDFYTAYAAQNGKIPTIINTISNTSTGITNPNQKPSSIHMP